MRMTAAQHVAERAPIHVQSAVDLVVHRSGKECRAGIPIVGPTSKRSPGVQMAEEKFKIQYTDGGEAKIARVKASSRSDAEDQFIRSKNFSPNISITNIEEADWSDSEHYFDLGEAFRDAKLEFQVGDTAAKAKSSAKLFGKTLANVGLFAGKLAAQAIKEAPQLMAQRMQEHLDKNPDMPAEQRAKAEELIARSKK